MTRFLRGTLRFLALCFLTLAPTQADELWCTFGITVGKPNATFHLSDDGTCKGRDTQRRFEMKLTRAEARAFYQALLDDGIKDIGHVDDWSNCDLSFSLVLDYQGERVEITGGDSRHAPTRKVHTRCLELFQKLRSEGA